MSKKLKDLNEHITQQNNLHWKLNSNEMDTDRIKEIQQETAYPDSVSVQQALLKVWNETEQEQLHIAVVMRSVLEDLRNRLERSRQLTQSFDEGEARWRDGMESGLETAIELLEDAMKNILTLRL